MGSRSSWAFPVVTGLISFAAVMVYAQIANPFRLWAFLLVGFVVFLLSRVARRIVRSRTRTPIARQS